MTLLFVKSPSIQSLREALLVAFLILIIGATGIVWFYHSSYETQLTEARMNLERLASAAATLVDGNLHQTLVAPQQSGGEVHRQVLAPLVRFHHTVPSIASLYTCVVVRGEVRVVLDTTANDGPWKTGPIPPTPSRIMDLYQHPNQVLLQALANGVVTSTARPWKNGTGEFMSGYAPIFNAQGRRIGVLGVDLSLADFSQPLQVIRHVAEDAAVGLVAIALIASTGVWHLRRKTREMELRNQKAQEELKMSEQRFRDVAGSAGEYIWETDHRGTYTFVTDRVTDVMGYTPTEMIGKTPLDFVHEGDKPEATHKQAFHLINKEPFRDVVHRKLTKNGEAIYLQMSGVPILDGDGIFRGFRGTGLDITTRKKVEGDLIRTKEAAEQADRAKGEFLAVMSHEIRTPMNGVIGFANILAATQLDQQQREYVDTIKSSAESLLGLINDVLDFSKIESGQLELETNPLSLRQCIEEVLGMNAQTINTKNLELVYDIENDVPDRIIGDASRLRQILLNLVSNAIKFTAAGEVVIRVSASKLSSVSKIPNYKIQFEIQDTGIGIAPYQLERLFKPFSQADSSTTRKYGGTGLGLVICKRLAEVMGGRISVESRPNEGSTFRFHIIVPAASVPEAVLEEETGRRAAMQGKRVLIVDDNATNRRILTRQFSRWGMIPTAAAGASEALAAFDGKRPFDIAVIDHLMPEMDGLQLARQIQAIDGASRLAMILLSQAGEGADSLKSRAAGFQITVMKPIRQSRLFEAVSDVLRNVQPQELRTEHFKTRTIARPPILAASIGPQHPLKILLAEDNPVNRRVVTLMLKNIGYHADTAENGALALAAMQEKAYDLILMDLQMPEVDGLEVTRRIRAWEKALGAPDSQRAPVYIIALTADAMSGVREDCLEAGMNDYLSKPVRPKDLIEALQRCAQAG